MRHGQLSEEAEVLLCQALAHEPPRNRSQIAEPVLTENGNVLGDAVVMVASHRVAGPVPHPIDTGRRLQSVIDQVAQAEANIVRLLDGLKGRPVRVDVGNQENPHVVPKPAGRMIPGVLTPLLFLKYTQSIILDGERTEVWSHVLIGSIYLRTGTWDRGLLSY